MSVISIIWNVQPWYEWLWRGALVVFATWALANLAMSLFEDEDEEDDE